jgi:hypothetical protein
MELKDEKAFAKIAEIIPRNEVLEVTRTNCT